jgi:predicted Fe-Mo cluster-binding NifX family protein
MTGGRWRAALASSDGATVNRHFGQATEFIIADVTADGGYKIAETRFLPSFCGGGHTDDALSDMLTTFADCDAVLAVMTGAFVRKELEKSGLLVLDDNSPIAEALPKLGKYLTRKNHPSKSRAATPGGG